MATFPRLKTDAVAQYPLTRTLRFQNQTLRFLDGSEQRFPGFGAPLRRWVIRLDLLDESELVNLEQFFDGQEGRAGIFSFTDPWDGAVYANCSFDHDDLALEFQGQERGKTAVVVKENRS